MTSAKGRSCYQTFLEEFFLFHRNGIFILEDHARSKIPTDSMLEGFFKFYKKILSERYQGRNTESPFVWIYISDHSPMSCHPKSTSQAPKETLENVCNSFTIMDPKQDSISNTVNTSNIVTNSAASGYNADCKNNLGAVQKNSVINQNPQMLSQLISQASLSSYNIITQLSSNFNSLTSANNSGR